MILNCVGSFCDPKLKDKLTNDLLNSINGRGSVNYWIAEDSLPDDLDDTFCIYSALYKLNPVFISGETFAKLSQLLIFSESEVGGPYYTWLMADKSINDIDPVVNCNILYFLSLAGVNTPNVTQYLINCLKFNKYSSQYYAGYIPALYFLSRIKDQSVQLLVSEKVKNIKGTSALDEALLLIIKLNLGHVCSLKPLESKLLGSLGDCNFIIERILDGNPHYLKSDALVYAFIAEAVYLFQNFGVQKPSQVGIDFRSRLVTDLQEFPADIKDKIITEYYPLAANNNRIQPILGFSRGSKVDNIVYNFLLGWLAYSIYDDIYDEGKNSQLLPACMYLLRRVFKNYSEYLEVFDQIDISNTQVLVPTSFLYKKSFGYALPFLQILEQMGFDKNSIQAAHLISFFRNFLIAKQLNDDAHDWEVDLQHNRMTVPTQLIRKYCLNATDKKEMRKTYWTDAIPVIGSVIQTYITKANSSLVFLEKDLNILPLKSMLSVQESAINSALLERRLVLDFLATYSIIE